MSAFLRHVSLQTHEPFVPIQHHHPQVTQHWSVDLSPAPPPKQS